VNFEKKQNGVLFMKPCILYVTENKFWQDNLNHAGSILLPKTDLH